MSTLVPLTPATFKMLRAWFEHPLVLAYNADPALMAAALECWSTHVELLVIDEPVEPPTKKFFLSGQRSVIELAKHAASQICRDSETVTTPISLYADLEPIVEPYTFEQQDAEPTP